VVTRLRIDVWSDIACPWCYVGKRRLARAIECSVAAASIDVVWRAFELNPAAPREIQEAGPYAERLARKYGSSVAQAEQRIARLVEVARSEGLELDFERIRPGNTFDAHRVLHHALEAGLQDAVKERFSSGYLQEGQAIGNPDVVLQLAVEAGLDADRVSALLSSDAYAREVRADEAEARRVGVEGVPFFVIGGRYAVSGAQPAELLSTALDRAWSEVGLGPVECDEGAACGPEGC
jgi:predicted DsbA family dithiol-disulfide isomerase